MRTEVILSVEGHSIKLDLHSDTLPDNGRGNPYDYRLERPAGSAMEPTVSPRATFHLNFDLNRITYRLYVSFQAYTLNGGARKFRTKRYLTRDESFPRKDPTSAALALTWRIEEGVERWLESHASQVLQAATAHAAKQCDDRIKEHTAAVDAWSTLKGHINSA